MKIKGTELKIIKADITELSVDAIVSPSHQRLLMDCATAFLIKKKGGEVIEKAASRKAPLLPGKTVWTKAGRLKAKYIIHASIMAGDLKTDETKIRLVCRSVFRLAAPLRLKALPFRR